MSSDIQIVEKTLREYVRDMPGNFAFQIIANGFTLLKRRFGSKFSIEGAIDFLKTIEKIAGEIRTLLEAQ